jgi:signal transduction histidine kinase
LNLSLQRIRHLLRTSALRLALRYAILQVGVLTMALGGLFVLLNRYVDRQIDSGLRGELAALSSLPAPARENSVRVLAHLQDEATQVRYYRLEDASGHERAGSLHVWPPGLPTDGRLHVTAVLVRETASEYEQERLPAVAVRLPEGGRLLIAQAPGVLEDLRETVLAVSAVLLGLSALLALALGASLGWRWLKRVEAINQTAGAIASGALSQRLAVSARADEFDLLAVHLNRMLGRIEAAIQGMRDVSDNIAHDLRRPLTRLKTRVEVMLAQPRDAAEYRTALAQTASDVAELMQIFDALLSIARLESGSEIAAPQVFDPAELAQGVAELYAGEAEDSGRPFFTRINPAPELRGQPALLAQALANLLDNAFKYTDVTVPVSVRVTADGAWVRLAVIDHGPGLTAAERERLVARFARGDAARSLPGSGLGLALVRAVAHAHEGMLELGDTAGGGLTASLVLPVR